VVFVPQYAGDVNQALTGVIYGGTLIAVVYLLPGGAAGLLRRLRRLLFDVVEPSPPPHTQRGVHDAVATSDPAPAGDEPAGRRVRP
jgi:hypothetical protein